LAQSREDGRLVTSEGVLSKYNEDFFVNSKDIRFVWHMFIECAFYNMTLKVVAKCYQLLLSLVFDFMIQKNISNY